MAIYIRLLPQLLSIDGGTPVVARLLTRAGVLEETQAALATHCSQTHGAHHTVLYPPSGLGAQQLSLHTSPQIPQQHPSPEQQTQEADPKPQLQPQQEEEKESIAQIRARIFGEPIRPGERTGRRVLARPLQGAQLASWYFLPPRMPGTHNEEREYVMLRRLNKRQKKQAEDTVAATGKKKR